MFRLRDYRFAITIAWFSFVTALAFIETPLRFMPESVTRVDSLAIGHLVFHALNYCELVFASLLLISEFSCRIPPKTDDCDSGGDSEYQDSNYHSQRDGRSSKTARRILVASASILLVQTVLLFTVLDQRTLSIINGQPVGEALYHVTYIVLEMIKLPLLILLSIVQVRAFERQCSSIARY